MITVYVTAIPRYVPLMDPVKRHFARLYRNFMLRICFFVSAACGVFPRSAVSSLRKRAACVGFELRCQLCARQMTWSSAPHCEQQNNASSSSVADGEAVELQGSGLKLLPVAISSWVQ